jgi:hypothetical protein
MKRDAQLLLKNAQSQANAVSQWRQSKRQARQAQYRRRIDQVKEAEPTAWLAAIRRDDMTDPAECELMLEKGTA